MNDNTNLRVGIISDVHILSDESIENFEKALRFFDESKVDAVLIPGDIADLGMLEQLELAGIVWNKVFPGDVAADGRKVEKLFIYGNHDIDGVNMGGTKNKFPDIRDRFDRAIFHRRAECWEKVFNEPYAPIYAKTIKGYTFVMAHFDNAYNQPGLREFLANLAPTLDKNKPFFYAQHEHPLHTVFSPYSDALDCGETTDILSQYPNCIAFSGHSHYPLTDEKSIWQGAFTSVNAASGRYIMTLSGRENSVGCFEPPYGTHRCYPIDPVDSVHALVMEVCDDKVILKRHEVLTNLSLGDDWVIPIGANAPKPYSYEERAKTSPVPEFPKDACVTIERIPGGPTVWDGDEERIVVSFPTAPATQAGNVRACDYAVAVEYFDWDFSDTYATKRAYSPAIYKPEACDTAPVRCPFALSELPPHKKFRFAVRPVNAFGGKGNPIYSDILSL